MAPSMLPYHEFGKMEENSKTRSKQESTKRNRVLEGRCVLENVTTAFWEVDLSNKRFWKKKCHFSVDFSLFRLISSHILIGGRGKEEWRKRQATRDKDRKWGERRKEEARRKKRAKEEQMQDKRVKWERRQKGKESSKERWMHLKQLVRIKTCVMIRTSAMKWGITLPRKVVMVVTKKNYRWAMRMTSAKTPAAVTEAPAP